MYWWLNTRFELNHNLGTDKTRIQQMPNKSMIVVDDSKVSRMMLTTIIQQMDSEMEISEAEDAKSALAVLQDKQIDYFSVDLNMPGMNGLELIEKLMPDYPTAKFALFTANIQDSTQDKCQSLGIKCVNKPITEDSVKSMLVYFND